MRDVSADTQPDQDPRKWDHHVGVYEEVFEPLTNRFAARAVAALDVAAGMRCLDVAAGTGGAALLVAARGAEILAIDASPGMAARIAVRARAAGHEEVRVAVMDGAALACPDAAFDAALSVFGLILVSDAVGALRETARVVKPGGVVALVAWSQPRRYELANRLFAAIGAAGLPSPRPAVLPAQLRFCEEAAFRELFETAGLAVETIEVVEEKHRAPSARWLADRLAYAPGLSVALDGQGAARRAVLDRFVADLEADQGRGPIALTAVASVGIGRTPSRTLTDR